MNPREMAITKSANNNENKTNKYIERKVEKEKKERIDMQS